VYSTGFTGETALLVIYIKLQRNVSRTTGQAVDPTEASCNREIDKRRGAKSTTSSYTGRVLRSMFAENLRSRIGKRKKRKPRLLIIVEAENVATSQSKYFPYYGTLQRRALFRASDTAIFYWTNIYKALEYALPIKRECSFQNPEL